MNIGMAAEGESDETRDGEGQRIADIEVKACRATAQDTKAAEAWAKASIGIKGSTRHQFGKGSKDAHRGRGGREVLLAGGWRQEGRKGS